MQALDALGALMEKGAIYSLTLVNTLVDVRFVF